MQKYNLSKCFRFDKKTDETLKNLLKIANEKEKRKVSESELLRQIIMQAKQEQMGIPKKKLTKMSRDMAGCGNNINQIAHRVNMDMYSFEDIRSLRNCMSDIAEIRKQLTELMKELY